MKFPKTNAMEQKLSEYQKKIYVLLNHIHTNGELIYFDALILEKMALANIFKIVVSETTEIRRIAFDVLHFCEAEIEASLLEVAREEIACHLYVVKNILCQLPTQISLEDFAGFKDLFFGIQADVAEVILYFEQVLAIPNEQEN
ncbi:MAG: hypothetical protein ACRC4W_03770, partial [Treponemataceae bacterium]